MPGPVQQFVGQTELGDRDGLPGAGGAGDDQAPAGTDRVSVQHDQAASGGDGVPDDRGGDHQKTAVMVKTGLVEGRLAGLAQRVVLSIGQPGRRTRQSFDEAAPAVDRGQVPLRVLGQSGRRCHERFQGASSGSNSPSGITSATDSSLSSASSSGSA